MHTLNLHVQDVGHTMIAGPIGAGKSTLSAFILAQFLRYEYALTKSVQGTHYHLLKIKCYYAL